MRRRKKLWITLGIIALLLVILHLILEPVVLKYLNKTLANLEGYRGRVEDVDIHLYRGAYQIDSIYINAVDSVSGEESPFFAASLIDISVHWAALFKGAVVGEIRVNRPRLDFTVQPGGEVSDGSGNDWVQTIKDLLPIQINRFEINNGQVSYVDPTSSPQVDISITEIQALATNLGNVVNEGDPLPSHINVSAVAFQSGSLNIDMGMHVLKEIPDFDLNMKADNIDLRYLNDFTLAYANFTFKDGELFVSSEVAMKDGQYDGYVKPLLQNVDVIDLKDKSTSFWRKAWEVVVGTVLELFENQKKDQFATEVPFEGNAADTQVGVLPTIGNVLKNAFVRAFQENINQTVNLGTIGEEEEKKGLFDFLKGDDKEEE